MTTRMSLPELGAWLNERNTRGLFRLETLPRYVSDSDGGDYERFLAGDAGPTVDKSGWSNLLRTARTDGRPWRRLRIIHTPMTDYERYSCSWGYPDNVAFGEEVRVLVVPAGDRTHELVGDFFVADDHHVARSHYGPDHRFTHAVDLTDTTEGDTLIGVRDLLWARAQPFTSWWAGTHTGTAQVA